MNPFTQQDHMNDLALTLIERSPHAILVCDAQGLICHINPTLTTLLGYSSESLIGEHINCLIPDKFKDHQHNVTAYFKQPQQDPMQNRGVLFARHQQGYDVAVDISLVHYRNSGQNYAVTIIRDNSELRTSLDAGNRSEIRFTGIFEQAPVAMALNDSQGNIIALNGQFTNLFGYDRLDIPTLTEWFLRAYPGADYRKSVMEKWHQVVDENIINGKDYAPIEVKITAKNGTVKICEVSACALEHNRHNEHLVILSDITERYQQAINDKESSSRFRDMISHHQLPMLIIEPSSGRILFSNDSACNFYGYSYRQLTCMRVHDFYHDDPVSIDRVLENVRNGAISSFSKTQYSHDGKAHNVDIYSSITDIGGNRFIYSIVIDNTEKHHVKAALDTQEALFQNLYNNSATAICSEDFSLLYQKLNELRTSGINDLQEYLDNNPEKLLEFSQLISVTDVNPAFKRLFSIDPSSTQAITIAKYFGEGAEDVFKKELLAIWQGSEKFESKANFIDEVGNKIIGVISLPLPTKIERSANIPVSIWDVTKLEDAQQEIEFHSKVLASLQEGVHLVDSNSGVIAYCNQRCSDMFGYSINDIVGMHNDNLNPGTTRKDGKLSNKIISDIKLRGFWQGEIQSKHANGELFWCEVIISTLNHPTFGSVLVYVQNDITDRRDYHQRLWRHANFDSLTQLSNKNYFYEQVKSVIRSAKRTPLEFAILFIDIDDFKLVNDTRGHNQGDALLIEVSSRLQQCVRQSDLIGRFGGDEFVVLMRDINTAIPSTIEILANKILSAISAPYYIQGELENITVSIGISTFPHNGIDIHELIQYSDQAMYKAKDYGKNQYHFFTPELQELAQRNRTLDLELRKAIDLNQLEIYLQPIVDSFNGATLKAEALIRWKHPELGFISPVEFIPIAENTKLICEIGNLVFDQCVEVLKDIKHLNIESFQISLNKSPVQLHSSKFHTEIDWPKVMEKEGLSTDSICIEITEGILLDEDEATHKKIHQLKSSGFNFSIDDFGTGYSALSYLQKVDFDYLKIDKSFIDSIETNSGNQALCQAIISMAHSLGMQVIAEGIETEKQHQQLKEMQCDYCQGYYFAKPMPRNDFISYLKNNL